MKENGIANSTKEDIDKMEKSGGFSCSCSTPLEITREPHQERGSQSPDRHEHQHSTHRRKGLGGAHFSPCVVGQGASDSPKDGGQSIAALQPGQGSIEGRWPSKTCSSSPRSR